MSNSYEWYYCLKEDNILLARELVEKRDLLTKKEWDGVLYALKSLDMAILLLEYNIINHEKLLQIGISRKDSQFVRYALEEASDYITDESIFRFLFPVNDNDEIINVIKGYRTHSFDRRREDCNASLARKLNSYRQPCSS